MVRSHAILNQDGPLGRGSPVIALYVHSLHPSASICSGVISFRRYTHTATTRRNSRAASFGM